MKDFYIKYILLLFLIIIFFSYGLLLSEAIDYVFPDCNNNLNEYHLFIEIIGELGIAYILYYLFEKYFINIINILYKKICTKPPFYLNKFLLISFSYGIYKHLQKSSLKIKYFKEKYYKMDYVNIIIQYYKKIINK